MSAYVIVDINVNDPKEYEEYKQMASETVEQYDGRYLVRGGRCEVLEGDWLPHRLVVLEFESFEKAKEWSQSPEYAPARALRQMCATCNMVVVEGTPTK